MNKILAATCVVVFGCVASVFAPKHVDFASPSKNSIHVISPRKYFKDLAVLAAAASEQAAPVGMIIVKTLNPEQLAAYKATLATHVKTDYALEFVDNGFKTKVDNQ